MSTVDNVEGSGHALAVAAAVNRSVFIFFRAHPTVGAGWPVTFLEAGRWERKVRLLASALSWLWR